MRIPSYILSLAIVLTGFSYAGNPTNDLAVARKKYEQAAREKIGGLYSSYFQRLEAIRLKYTKAGDLKGALVVDAEIEKVKQWDIFTLEGISDTAIPKSPPGKDPGSRPENIRRLIEGTSWSWGDGVLVFGKTAAHFKAAPQRAIKFSILENGFVRWGDHILVFDPDRRTFKGVYLRSGTARSGTLIK